MEDRRLSHCCKETDVSRAGADKTQEYSFCVDINEGTNCVKERLGVDSVEIRLVTYSHPDRVLFCCMHCHLHTFVFPLH